MSATLQTRLASLTELSHRELKEEWERLFGAPAPAISSEQLRLGVAHKLQEQRLGGLSREVRALLKRCANAEARMNDAAPVPRNPTAGTKLVRDWHGVGHTVTVLDKGFEYDGRHWNSLTAIAKAITGSHRNGPNFFGLRD